MNLEIVSYWQVSFGRPEGAVVGITPYVLIESGISILAGSTTDAESIARPLSSLTTILSSRECTADHTAIHRRRCRLPLRIDDDRLHQFVDVVDLGRRVHAQVS